MADRDDILNNDDDAPTDEIFLEEEREAGDEENDLILAEEEAVKEEESSEPDIDDIGIEDEEDVYRQLYEEGAGADVEAKDIEKLGWHVEQFANEPGKEDESKAEELSTEEDEEI